MKTDICRGLVGAVMGFAMCVPALSQDSRVRAAAGDKYVISAKAGGINATEGNVSVARANGQGGSLLKGDDLDVGDRVSTGADGKAEILLNPGSFLRLGSNTTFEFLTTSLDDLRLKLASGSAVFEVIADDDFRVTLLMPRTAMALTRSGIYRIDILEDRSSKLSVLKGKVFLGAEGKTSVKAGKTATVVGINAEVAKFDRDEQDALTLWSKDRAKQLSKVNAQLQRDSMRRTLLSSFNSRGGWNLYESFGLWVFDPIRRSWCFMPFGSGWGSPYGYLYGFDLWNVRLPNWVYYAPPPQTVQPSTRAPGVPTPNGPITGRGDNTERRNRIHTPPFQRIQESPNNSGAGVVDRGGNYGNSGPPIFSGSSSPLAPSSPHLSSPSRGNIERPAASSPIRTKGRPDNR